MNTIHQIFDVIGTRRELILALVKRELKDKHAGQAIGVAWSFGHPVLLMILYAVLFAYVFPARFTDGNVQSDFSANILAGIICWLIFQDILAKSPGILTSHSNLVTQIVFPVEVLPIKTVIAVFIPYAGGLVFAIIYSAFKGNLSLFILALPVLILFQLIAMAGIAFLVSVFGIFLKDIRDIIVVFNSINLFAQPILYNPNAIPDLLNWVFIINPFSYVVWCWQDVLYYGRIEHPAAWLIFPLGSLLLFLTGLNVFERSKNTFGDYLS
jgi:lipopolysaccharide transport system permease protein